MDPVVGRRIQLTCAFIFSLVLSALGAACTSSSIDVAAPSASKCGVTATSSITSAPAGGAVATVTVDITRDCTWSATTDASWITLGSTTAGQGSGSIDVRIAANPSPAARDGTISVNDQDITISQAAAPCTFSVTPANATINPGGGIVSVQVSTIGGCTWTASSAAPWLTVSGGGNGAGSATIAAAANGGPARSATTTIAGQTVTITQTAQAPPPSPTPDPAPAPSPAPNPAPACSYSLSPASYESGPAGAVFSVSLNTGGGCAWTAQSNSSWITVTSAASESGPGTVVLSVAANTGGARAGTVSIGGQLFNVKEEAAAPPPPPPCSYTISPKNATLSAKGGGGSVAVTTGPACTWTATSRASWITITGGASGTGNGTVNYTVSANGKNQRDGSISIADETFEITQTGSKN